jgi:hypothetical protein
MLEWTNKVLEKFGLRLVDSKGLARLWAAHDKIKQQTQHLSLEEVKLTQLVHVLRAERDELNRVNHEISRVNQGLLDEQDKTRRLNQLLQSGQDGIRRLNQKLEVELDKNLRAYGSAISEDRAAENPALTGLHFVTVPRGSAVLKQGILLNALPKSGTVHMARSLAKILGAGIIHLGNQYRLVDQINFKAAEEFSRGGYISPNELSPSSENIELLKYFRLKMVLHLRDPRQALLEWVHHVDRVTGGDTDHPLVLSTVPRPPNSYFQLSP